MNSLRLRITLSFAIACIAVVTALSFTLYTASEELEQGLVDQMLSEEVDYLVDRYRSNPAYRPTAGPNREYFIARSAAELAALPAHLRALPSGMHEFGSGEEERHALVKNVDGTRYIVVYDVGPHELREQRFKGILLLALATVAFIAFVLGYWLAGVLTRQLDDLASAVSALAPTGATPLARPNQDREVAALARALDEYQVRIARLIEREQEFTANASHELRTPLTIIQTSCELLATDATLSAKARERLSVISAAVERITGQLKLLLYLARENVASEKEPVALAACVRDAAEAYRSELERKGVAFELAIDSDAEIVTDRHALSLVVANLIKNATQHTARGHVRVSYASQRLTVADTGSGIPADELPRVFERHYRGTRGTQGLGLGLAIVQRICERLGWKAQVASNPGTGSAFTIVFP